MTPVPVSCPDMELDTISIVKIPHVRRQERREECGVESWPYLSVEQDLQRAVSFWKKSVEDCVNRRNLHLRWRDFRWSEVDVMEELPTDLLTYFVHRLEPDIGPEIGNLLLDGHVHIVLVLSHCEIPRHTDWFQGFDALRFRGIRSPGGIIVTEPSGDENKTTPFIRFHEMSAFDPEANLPDLVEEVLERKL